MINKDKLKSTLNAIKNVQKMRNDFSHHEIVLNPQNNTLVFKNRKSDFEEQIVNPDTGL